MPAFKRIEDIEAWQLARELAKEVIMLFRNNVSLKREFTLKDQMIRASISIMSNIAEGFARNTDKEFSQYLYIAKGSTSELKSLLYTIQDAQLITADGFSVFYDKASRVEKVLSGLISYLKRK